MVVGGSSVDESWLAAVRALAAAPNVTFKLSGLVTRSYPKAATIPDLEPYVRALSDLVGPERILFGSDWPVCTAVTDYAGVVGTCAGAHRAVRTGGAGAGFPSVGDNGLSFGSAVMTTDTLVSAAREGEIHRDQQASLKAAHRKDWQ